MTLVSPEPLKMPSEIVRDLKSSGGHIEESEKLIPAISSADVVYMTRIQRERFPDEAEYEKVAGIYTLKAEDLMNVQSHMMIMHTLPRVNEIHLASMPLPMLCSSNKHSTASQLEWHCSVEA